MEKVENKELTIKDLDELLEKLQKEEEEKWNNMTPQEKLDTYREQGVYTRYCDMSIEELEEEKKFNQDMANKLRHSMFGHPYYSAYGCDENVRRINTIIELKK